MDLGPIREYDPIDIDGDAREASVLLPIVDRPTGPHLLFTKRADHLENHPGQMSFPGGRREPEDDNRVETALREANEEIGLRPTEARLHGRLDDLETVSAYVVRPYVGTIPDRSYTPNDGEVAEITVLSLSGILDPNNHESECRDHPRYGEIQLHYFRVDGYTVWGATANILVQFLELTTDWRAPGELDCATSHETDLTT
ncbi:NUDIX hydrolase [Halapricum desulfuricans]|uniref:NUDIX family hydrolase n=1 Tax=Halapricum desulfuricans TaxID=2841257 RepID=A0A897N7V6_9EURY|nr:CoA pyrophosphatase [Halapricum desulfuricans]QSG07263.1 NUDIX family hydrolase [Halapricum desulfuricans]